MKAAAAFFGVIAIMTGIAWIVQRATTAELRATLSMQNDLAHELAHLKEEHANLVSAAVAPTELAALRADHAAIVQLRNELSALQQKSPSSTP